MEALTDSNEVLSAKKVRTAAKGALTRVANQLKKVLVLKPGEKYDFLKLDKFSLEAYAENLKRRTWKLFRMQMTDMLLLVEVYLREKMLHQVFLIRAEIEQYSENKS